MSATIKEILSEPNALDNLILDYLFDRAEEQVLYQEDEPKTKPDKEKDTDNPE
ncbi:hypothetical protein [Lewinella sp. W8]|uniref:hypothetical protein n=1 Tax=Lewinella sp. W8 TaxID=2528208 RepID=UPI0012B57D34|nr:hypothetical protein [Lewinella sp. W8]MTB53084.1 hypothetical protein [Lewinella sp. W8]